MQQRDLTGGSHSVTDSTDTQSTSIIALAHLDSDRGGDAPTPLFDAVHATVTSMIHHTPPQPMPRREAAWELFREHAIVNGNVHDAARIEEFRKLHRMASGEWSVAQVLRFLYGKDGFHRDRSRHIELVMDATQHADWIKAHRSHRVCQKTTKISTSMNKKNKAHRIEYVQCTVNVYTATGVWVVRFVDAVMAAVGLNPKDVTCWYKL